MTRRKLNLTTEQREDRRELERQRSLRRRQAAAQQHRAQLVEAVARDPAVSILDNRSNDETGDVAVPHSTEPTERDNDPESRSSHPSAHQHRDDAAAALPGRKELRQRKPASISDVANKTGYDGQKGAAGEIRQEPGASGGRAASASPSLRSCGGRYDLRERKSPTPTTSGQEATSNPPKAANSRGDVNPTLHLPLRPAARAAGGEPIHDGVVAQDGIHTGPNTVNTSTPRVQQHRSRKRNLRREEVIATASLPHSQIRVVSIPEEPACAPAAVVADQQREAGAAQEPNDIFDNGEGDGTEAEDTFVRSVIVVSVDGSDQPSLPAITRSEVDPSTAYAEVAGDNIDSDSPDTQAENGVDRPGVDASDGSVVVLGEAEESGLFISDDSWVLGGDDLQVPTTYTALEAAAQSHQDNSHATDEILAPAEEPSVTPVAPSPVIDPLAEAVAAIESAESPAGLEFINRQATVYRRIFKEAYALGCSCGSQPAQDSASSDDEGAFSIKEMSRWFRAKLGPIGDILRPSQPGSRQSTALSDRRQWEAPLSEPPATLSLARSERDIDIPIQAVTVERAYDVDSIFLGLNSLEALGPDNDSFRLSFSPPYSRSIAGNRIIQPHGIDLGHTRHTLLGSFIVPGCPVMDVFLFFPNTNDGKPVKPKRARQQRGANSPYTLSTERQKDFFDGAVLPALRSSVPPLYRQEMPPTYEIARAKSLSFQERPGTDRWLAEDRSRAVHLRYTIPGRYLGAFWRELRMGCDRLRIPVAKGTAEFAYFQGPRILAQVHDTKNVFSQPTLGKTVDRFVHSVLQSLNPAFLDFSSCWVDIGFRDMANARQADGEEDKPVTLLWKKSCVEHFHSQIAQASPHMQLKAEYFRTLHLRDSANYTSKSYGISGRVPRPDDPGNPSCTKLGVFHSKAYNCDKERFSVLSGDYQPFAAPALAALALTDPMMRDVFAAAHDSANAVTGAPQRKRLEEAWEANKRHLRAVAGHVSPTNGYAARKEITFRLDVILMMHHRGEFIRDDGGDSHGAAGGAPATPLHGAGEHYPFWILATRDINEFVCTAACRFVGPLDYIFTVNATTDDNADVAKQGGRSLVYYYTAQLLLRLLVSSLTSERDWYSDKWIWQRDWLSKETKEGVRKTYQRRGLGLLGVVNRKGLVWLHADHMDWMHGHLSISKLLQLYIPRSLQHPEWASQSNIRAFAHNNVSAAYLIEDLLARAGQIRQHDRASLHTAIANEKTAVQIAVQEVGREYGIHLLEKLQVYWRNSYGTSEAARRKHPNGPCSLVKALEGLRAPVGKMITPHTLLEIFDEAWYIHHHGSELDSVLELPTAIPIWMAKRKPTERIWTRVVFETLFDPDREVTWARNSFRLLYERLGEVYDKSRHADASPFSSMFRERIGRYITVTFNPDRTKEVNTSHGAKFKYNHLPTFFKVQFWAPIINPFRYNADIFKFEEASFPISDQEKRAHRQLHLRNLGIMQDFRDVRELAVTTSWVAMQPADVIQRLACDLESCQSDLLRLTTSCRLMGPEAAVPASIWDFNDPESAALQLWEVPLECAAIDGDMLPTVIPPTAPVLRFLMKASRAAIAATPSLPGSGFDKARDALRRLRGWTDIIGSLLENRANLACLTSVKLDLLEEVKSWHEDVGSDALLLQFLNQAKVPQTCVHAANRVGDETASSAEDDTGDDDVASTSSTGAGSSAL